MMIVRLTYSSINFYVRADIELIYNEEDMVSLSYAHTKSDITDKLKKYLIYAFRVNNYSIFYVDITNISLEVLLMEYHSSMARHIWEDIEIARRKIKLNEFINNLD